MQRVLFFILACVLIAPQASAEIEYREGRVVITGPYTGQGITIAEFGALGAGVVAAQMVRPEWASAGGPMAALITWGAWRTDQYRPQAVKDQISAARASRDGSWYHHQGPLYR